MFSKNNQNCSYILLLILAQQGWFLGFDNTGYVILLVRKMTFLNYRSRICVNDKKICITKVYISFSLICILLDFPLPYLLLFLQLCLGSHLKLLKSWNYHWQSVPLNLLPAWFLKFITINFILNWNNFTRQNVFPTSKNKFFFSMISNSFHFSSTQRLS